MKCETYPLWVLLSYFFFQGIAYSTIDDLENKLREEEPIQLRWDNIDGEPFWISGPSPHYDAEHGFNVVTLSSKEPVTVRLTKEAYLRIRVPSETLSPCDLEVLVSNGSGLYAEQKLMVSGNDMILAPANYEDLIVKVSLKPSKKTSVQVGLFLSRYEPPAPMAPYRTHLESSDESIKLLSHTTGVPENSIYESFYALNPQRKAILEVEGPRRLNLSTKYVYDHLDTGHTFMYRVNVLMDGKIFHTSEYTAQPDQNNMYYKLLDYYILGFSDINSIEIPSGNHTLTLDSNANIFYQIQELEDTGYLVPFLNAPSLLHRPATPNLSALTLPEKDIKQLEIPELRAKMAPSYLQLLATKLGKDNFWRADGLQSGFLLNEVYQKRLDALDLLQARDQSLGLFTFYRDLLPSKGIKQNQQKYAYVIDWNLRDPKDEGKETFVLESHKDDLLTHLIGGYFYHINCSEEDPLTYTLPDRQAPSFLRIVVNQTMMTSPQSLWIQYDRNEPFKLLIFPHRDLAFKAYKPTRGLMGLRLMNDSLGTLGGLFNIRAEPGPLYSAGVLEIPLDADVKQVKIWGADKNSNPIEIALHYQTSRPYRLEQRMMLEEIQCVKNAEDLFISALEFVIRCQTEKKKSCDFNAFWEHLKGYGEEQKQSVAELYNHWLKLLRFLAGRHQRLMTSIGETDLIYIQPGKGKSSQEKVKKAENLFQERKYQDSFDVWTELLNTSDAAIWRKAHIERVRALQNLGEVYLAGRYLQTIFLKSHDKNLQREAFDYLLSFYQKNQDYFSLEAILTQHIIKTKDTTALLILSEVLLEDNNPALGLDLAHIINPKKEKPTKTLVFTALRENRARNGERLGESIETSEESCFWNAQLDQIDGHYEKALEGFKKAGKQGKVWHDHLSEGLLIQKKLYAADLKTRESAIVSWMAWTRDLPGPYHWAPADYLVIQSSQTTTLYSPVIDQYAFLYLAKPKEPLQLKVIGPAQIQFHVRVIFNKSVPIPYKGWLEIKDNDVSLDRPILYTFPSEDLQFIENTDQPGFKMTYDITVGSGEHTISLTPQNASVIVAPFINKPILPLTVLPPITHDSLALILSDSWKGKMEDDELPFYFLLKSNGSNSLKSASANPSQYQLPVQSRLPFFEQVLKELSGHPEIKPYISSPEDTASQHLSMLLKAYEENPHEGILIEAQQYWDEHREFTSLSLIWNRFMELSSWTPIEIPQKSAGVRSFSKENPWEPDVPELILRKNLMKNNSDEYVLTGTSPLVFQLFNNAPISLKILSSLANLISEDFREVVWGYQIDEGEKHSIRFTPSHHSAENELKVPKGEHSLRVFLEKPTAGTFVKLNIFEKNEETLTWNNLSIESKKDYLVATSTDPVVLDINGPAWLLIEEWKKGEILSKNYFVKEGSKKIILKPAQENGERLFRIYRRIARSSDIAEPGAPVPAQYVSIEANPVFFKNWEPSYPIQGQEVLPLGGQELGTLSLSASLNRTIAADVITPNKLSDTVDRYVEERATYRYFDELRRIFWRGDILTRQRKSGSPTLGIEGSAEYSPIDFPLTFWTLGTAYTQAPNMTFLYSGTTTTTPPKKFFQTENSDKFLYTGTIEAGIRHKLVFNEKIDQRMDLSILGRKTRSIFNAPSNTKIISSTTSTTVTVPDFSQNIPDPDVYTKYLATHPKALNFSYKVYYRPFMDTQIWAQFSDTTTPALNFSKPDSTSMRVGLDQLLGPVILNFGFGRRHYYKTGMPPLTAQPPNWIDPNRQFPFNRYIVDGGFSWNIWLRNHNRLEWKLNVSRVVDKGLPTLLPTPTNPNPSVLGVNTWIGFISFTWHFGNGRDFRDFSPDEILFKDLRERHLPPVQIPQGADKL